MLLYESRKLASACRKAFIETVYGESEDLYDSVFEDASDFEAFMNTLVKPSLPKGWQLSGDISVDKLGNTRDDVILYKELDDGSFCTLVASILEKDTSVSPTYSVEFSEAAVVKSEKDEDKDHPYYLDTSGHVKNKEGNVIKDDDLKTATDNAEKNKEELVYNFSSDDINEFVPVYNSLQDNNADYVNKFDFGSQNDPLSVLIDFVGYDSDEKNSLRYAIAKKVEEEKESEQNENEANNNELDSNNVSSDEKSDVNNNNNAEENEILDKDFDDNYNNESNVAELSGYKRNRSYEESVDDTTDLIPSCVKVNAKKEIDSW